jgi:hypothetical protein
MIPASDDNLQSGGVPPTLSPQLNPKSRSTRHLFAIMLSLCLALFLVDAVVSFADDSLILFCGLHPLSAFRGLTSFFALFMAVGVYGLIGLTPMVPKRLFLPIPVFTAAAMLALFPFAIYCFGRLQQIAWGISLCQVIVGLGILYWSQGGLKFRWPLVLVDKFGARLFSWRNLSVFVLINVFVLSPAVVVYMFFWTVVAVNHFSDGFMALRPDGFTVQVRKYVRNDGKTIELFPMSHVADAAFYRRISQMFPTNSVILMEGVTDDQNLLTNKISYRRMAQSLGLAEQKKEFVPRQGEMVRADVDVDQFSRDTIDFLNLIMLVHSKGLNSDILLKFIQYSPPPQIQEELFDDLLRKRNQHLLEEIQSHLAQSDNIMVPWGVAHMPEIAKAIQNEGFRLDQIQSYFIIQFVGKVRPRGPAQKPFGAPKG